VSPEIESTFEDVPKIVKCTGRDRLLEESKYFWESIATTEMKTMIKQQFNEWKLGKKKINDTLEPTLSDSEEEERQMK
jgi:hypothetical protein